MECDWIGPYFDDYAISFPNSGRVWRVGQRISEKLLQDPDGVEPVEAQGVYHCHQNQGSSKGQGAIMKIRMQVPPPATKQYTRAELRKLAVQMPAAVTKQEVCSLEWLTERGCTASPKLYEYCSLVQEDDMPVPGGYVIVIVMEKLPGKSLDLVFWDYTREERDRIGNAFRHALTEVYKHRVVSADRRLPNVHYDEATDKCYILDYEQSLVTEDPYEWNEIEWGLWGLVGTDGWDDLY